MDPRIPLKIANGLIHTVALVRVPSLRVCGVNKFFVDTGSPESFIGEYDANRLHIPMKRLNFTKSALMGGTKISLAQIRDVALHFQTEERAITIKYHARTPAIAASLTDHIGTTQEWVTYPAVHHDQSQTPPKGRAEVSKVV
jgi:hypothetical protein